MGDFLHPWYDRKHFSRPMSIGSSAKFIILNSCGLCSVVLCDSRPEGLHHTRYIEKLPPISFHDLLTHLIPKQRIDQLTTRLKFICYITHLLFYSHQYTVESATPHRSEIYHNFSPFHSVDLYACDVYVTFT